METNTETTDSKSDSYQVLVCNIAWDKKATTALAKKTSPNDLPDQISFDVPKVVLAQANRPGIVFEDVIEQFVYNLLYKKFGYIANRCQVWLPFEEQSIDK